MLWKLSVLMLLICASELVVGCCEMSVEAFVAVVMMMVMMVMMMIVMAMILVMMIVI